MNINDLTLRQYIDQVFLRYDYNRTGSLNLTELHDYLNELFRMCGVFRNVSYMEAYQALMQVDANRDGQVNKFELFNLFKFMTQPGFRPLPYTFRNYSYGGINTYGGLNGPSMNGYALGGITGGLNGGINGCGINSFGTNVIRQQPVATYTTVTTNPIGCGTAGIIGSCDPTWNSNWHGWGY